MSVRVLHRVLVGADPQNLGAWVYMKALTQIALEELGDGKHAEGQVQQAGVGPEAVNVRLD